MPGIEARAPERTETSSGFSASPKFLPAMRPTSASAASTCGFRSFGIGLAVGVEIGADLGGDGEARRHRQAEIGHFGKIRALAAEEIAHVGAPCRLAAAESVDPFGLFADGSSRLRRPRFSQAAAARCARHRAGGFLHRLTGHFRARFRHGVSFARAAMPASNATPAARRSMPVDAMVDGVELHQPDKNEIDRDNVVQQSRDDRG